jgi:hypothetical protein
MKTRNEGATRQADEDTDNTDRSAIANSNRGEGNGCGDLRKLPWCLIGVFTLLVAAISVLATLLVEFLIS